MVGLPGMWQVLSKYFSGEWMNKTWAFLVKASIINAFPDTPSISGWRPHDPVPSQPYATVGKTQTSDLPSFRKVGGWYMWTLNTEINIKTLAGTRGKLTKAITGSVSSISNYKPKNQWKNTLGLLDQSNDLWEWLLNMGKESQRKLYPVLSLLFAAPLKQRCYLREAAFYAKNRAGWWPNQTLDPGLP